MTARHIPDNPQRKIYEGMGSRVLVQSDFLEPPASKASDGVGVAIAGAGALVGSIGTQADHPGTWALFTGTTAAGRVFIISSGLGSYQVGAGGITRTGTWISTGAVLSTALQRYTIRAGFFNVTLPNNVFRGIGFEYDDSQNGGRWQLECVDAGGVTTVDSGVLVAINTWYFLEWEANAAGTSVEFFIDGVSVGTIATNIPTLENMFYNTHIMKLIGTTNTLMAIDAYYVYQEIAR